MTLRSVGIREVVAHVPDPLILVPRIVLIRSDREARERDSRRSDRDAIRLLPMVRPAGEILVGETEDGLPHFELVHRRIVENLSQLAEAFPVVFLVGPGRARETRVSGAKRLKDRRL